MHQHEEVVGADICNRSTAVLFFQKGVGIARGVAGSTVRSTDICLATGAHKHGTIIHTRMSSLAMSQPGTHLVPGDDPGADLLDKSRHGDCCGRGKRQAVAPPRTGKAQAQQQRERRKRRSEFSQS